MKKIILLAITLGGLFLHACGGEKTSMVPTNLPEDTTAIAVQITTNRHEYKRGETIELTMKVSNYSTEQFMFLPWGTPMEKELTNDCLTIVINGDTLPYLGIIAKRSPATKSDYVTLQPNEFSEGKVEIQNNYPMQQSGVYTLQFLGTYSDLPASNSVQLSVR